MKIKGKTNKERAFDQLTRESIALSSKYQDLLIEAFEMNKENKKLENENKKLKIELTKAMDMLTRDII